jgi:hypothetical protein
VSYADYCRHRPILVTCHHCGWVGNDGDDCDCERMEGEMQIAATLREAGKPDE